MRLLFVTSNRLGDAVLSTGLLAHLIESHPGVRVTVAAGPIALPLFQAVPGLEDLIALPKRPWKLHWLELWQRTVGKRWDLVVDLRRSMIPWTVRRARAYVLPRDDKRLHRVVMIASILGLERTPPPPRVWLAPAHEELARDLVPQDGTLAIGPTANWAGKIWPAERFAELAERLTRPGAVLAGRPIAVFGAGNERMLAEPVLERLQGRPVLDLVGQTDLLTAAACLRRCALYVGSDSGLMHLAAAAGTPTLGLFGPSWPELYAPWGTCTAVARTDETFAELAARPGYDPRTTGSLMGGLPVERAEAAAVDLLQRLESATA